MFFRGWFEPGYELRRKTIYVTGVEDIGIREGGESVRREGGDSGRITTCCYLRLLLLLSYPLELEQREALSFLFSKHRE